MKDHVQTQQKNQILDSLFGNFRFSNLTEIQQKASPKILQKKDCLVIAPTGSGKTECSVIPIFFIVKKFKKTWKNKDIIHYTITCIESRCI